jgi:hypothetical protein
VVNSALVDEDAVEGELDGQSCNDSARHKANTFPQQHAQRNQRM